MALGPRNIQLAALKIKALTVLKAKDGSSKYLLKVPGAEQRGQNIREELKSRALDHDLGQLLEVHIENIKEYHRENLTDIIDAGELPIFPNWLSSNPVFYLRVVGFKISHNVLFCPYYKCDLCPQPYLLHLHE